MLMTSPIRRMRRTPRAGTITPLCASIAMPRHRPAPTNVTARFLYADYGLGVPYQDISASPSATLTFAASGDVKVRSGRAGVQWDLPATRSTHICLAVEISAPGDPYIPELAGRAPGWPTTDWTIPADNNKAQRNMDLPAMGAGAGTASFHAIAHNAALFTRDMVIRYSVPPRILRMLEGGQIGVVGGEMQPLGESGTLTLTNMQPAENRWTSPKSSGGSLGWITIAIMSAG